MLHTGFKQVSPLVHILKQLRNHAVDERALMVLREKDPFTSYSCIAKGQRTELLQQANRDPIDLSLPEITFDDNVTSARTMKVMFEDKKMTHTTNGDAGREY